MNYKIAILACSVAAAMLTACDEDTASLGIVDAEDLIVSSDCTFPVRSSSVLLDSVIASSGNSYLGEIIDEETQSVIRAEFLCQFHTPENYTLPDTSLIVKNETGEIEADSAELRLYFHNYYGLGSNPMKLAVYELDSANVLREDQPYYSNLKLESYLPKGAQPLVTKVFSPVDYTLPEVDRISTNHYDNVDIRLPKSFGTRILRAASEHPEWFLNSWQFLHHVCPGFYFHLLSGRGTMLELDVSAMNIFFRYRDAEKDTIYNAYSRFSATPEVIQSTRIQNSDLTSLLDSTLPYTYLKSPAGVATELTLPVDEIFQGHEKDSVSRARIILTRMNSTSQSDYVLDPPSNLLLVRKENLHSFFSNKQLPDSRTSYTTSFDATYNTYTFTNISRLLSYLHRMKLEGMVAENLSSEQWNGAHPDWNKVMLLPVAVTTSSSNTGTSTLTGITHDFSLHCARLVGGSQPLTMQVIYSSYQ